MLCTAQQSSVTRTPQSGSPSAHGPDIPRTTLNLSTANILTSFCNAPITLKAKSEGFFLGSSQTFINGRSSVPTLQLGQQVAGDQVSVEHRLFAR